LITYTNNTRESGYNSAANSLAVSAGEPAFELQDNRPQSVVQRKHVEAMANGGPAQKKANSISTTPVIQKVEWKGLGRTAIGAIGAVGGAAKGAVMGSYRGYQEGSGVVAGGLNGLVEGGREGYEKPGATLGAIVGGALGAATGSYGLAAVGAAGGALAGDALNEKLNPTTKIEHTPGYITLANGTHHEVGKKMVAKLSAGDPVKGSATGVNWTWMQDLRLAYPKANVVRGHLLNHDLGGFGMPENLYPISTKANQDHSSNVEQPVKKLLHTEIEKRKLGVASKKINYTVEVQESQSHDPVDATFRCEFYPDGENKKTANIRSVLNQDKGGFGGVKVNPLDGTDWHHGDRKGFEGAEEKEALAGYKGAKKINVKGKSNGLTPNVNAGYAHGAGLVKENEDNIFEHLERNYFKWDKHLKGQIVIELGTSGIFSKGVLDFVHSTASYNDDKNDQNNFIILIAQVIQEKLGELLNKFPAHYKMINDAINDTKKITG